MLTDERRTELSDVLRPAAPPREISDVYTPTRRSVSSTWSEPRGHGS